MSIADTNRRLQQLHDAHNRSVEAIAVDIERLNNRSAGTIDLVRVLTCAVAVEFVAIIILIIIMVMR